MMTSNKIGSNFLALNEDRHDSSSEEELVKLKYMVLSYSDLKTIEEEDSDDDSDDDDEDYSNE